MSKLLWEEFEPLFGDWSRKIKPFFDKGGFDPIYTHLKKESRRGRILTPESELTFRCFKETPFDELRVVMCGMSPYHSIVGRTRVADGLLMGCSITNKLQPSLLKFYEGIHKDVYFKDDKYCKNPDVSYLAKQGVLMLNIALTTELRKPDKHIPLWRPFADYLFKEVINPTGVPVILLGKEAAHFRTSFNPIYGTIVYVTSHPASAAHLNTDWETKDLYNRKAYEKEKDDVSVFKRVNYILKNRHGIEIEWLDMEPF